MPTFCRHNRFIERCPICSKTLPQEPVARRAPAKRTQATKPKSRSGESQRIRVHRESRSEDDGYRSPLVPGLHSSADAERLASEIGFAAGRLAILREQPPDLYTEVRAESDLEQASWICFLATYLSPLQDDDPFRGIRAALDQPAGDWYSGLAPDLQQIPLGPRTSHDPARGSSTLQAYRRWAQNAGSQARGFAGDGGWSPGRRFERVFDRLAIAGFNRAGRYELLVTLAALGLYELQADALHLIHSSGRSPDPTILAAKRIFGIGDAINLERRALALAREIGIPVAPLDLALANWGSDERVTLGVPAQTCDHDALRLSELALGL
ncbi:MAG TPA: hypothetical protein VGF15_00780 [Solirubrobacteraceae bacterium]